MSRKTIAELQLKGSGGKQVASQLDQVGKATERVGRQQTRLGQASASAGRQFSAQATGLGGLVSAYAGAAATVFAITAAFQALNQAAQTAQVVEGLNALATTVGTTGSEILKRSQEVTRGLVSIRETAESVNIGLSAGFNQDQILELQKVSLGASRALGRTLTDALTRVTRGAAKLEPELLDELGIFVKIDPAVEAYAAKLNKTASSLTDFERRQAFVNAIIDQGTAKFSIIDTTSGNALESLQRLSTVIVDLGAKVGGALANAIAPFADYISGDLGNTLAVFGILARTVFGSALGVAIGGIKSTTEAAQGLANALGERALGGNAEKQGIAFGKLALATEKLDLRYITGSRSAAKYTKELIRQAREGTLAVQDLSRLESRLLKLRDETKKGSDRFLEYNAALRRVRQAQTATGKTSLLLANALSSASKVFGVVGVGIASVLRGLTSFITAISVARLVLKPFTDALGVTDEIDDFVATLFNLSLRLFGVDDASRAAKKGFDGLASSLLSANEVFADLPDKIDVAKTSLFGLTTLTKELTQQELAAEFSELLSNLGDSSAIDDFRNKFTGLTFEARQALEALVNEAVRFQSTFGRAGEGVAKSLGEVNRQTGVAVKSLSDFLFAQQQLSGSSFQGVSLIDGGQTNQFNLQLAETGQLLKIQVGDTERINDLLKAGNVTEAERLTIGAGVVGLLAAEAKFRADLEEGNLNAEQLKKTESALQTTLNTLLERAVKLGDDRLKTQIKSVEASQDQLTAETEIQTQQDLFNKRIRKDFSAQLSAAGKLNGLASLDLQLATKQSEIKRNQLDQITAILATEVETSKEKTLQETVSKVAAGLVSTQLQDIRKMREEEEKRLIALQNQLAILEKQSTVKDTQRELKALQQQNSITDKQASQAEKIRKAEVELNKVRRQESLKVLQDQADLQKSLLDKRSGLFTEQQLQDLKIQIDEKALLALRAETAKQIVERERALAQEITLLDEKTARDTAAFQLEKDVVEQQAALELEKIKQDGMKFDLEQKLRDQRVEELKFQSNIFQTFIENFAKLLAGLSADIKIATDPNVRAQIAGGANIDQVRQSLTDAGIAKISPQLSEGLDASVLEQQQTDIKAAFDKITQIRIAEIAKEERANEESIDRKIEALRKSSDEEAKLLALQAEKDKEVLLNTVSARQRAIDADKRLNQALSTQQIAVLSLAENLRGGFEGALMSLNEQLINGTLTMDSIGNTFNDMLGNMLRSVQAQVFQESIAKPIASSITSFLPKLFNAGGLVHMAGGGMKRDRVPAMLEPGEFVIRKEAAKKLGMSKLKEMNSGITPDPLAMLIAQFGGSKVRQMAEGTEKGLGPSGSGGASSSGGFKEGPPGASGPMGGSKLSGGFKDGGGAMAQAAKVLGISANTAALNQAANINKVNFNQGSDEMRIDVDRQKSKMKEVEKANQKQGFFSKALVSLLGTGAAAAVTGGTSIAARLAGFGVSQITQAGIKETTGLEGLGLDDIPGNAAGGLIHKAAGGQVNSLRDRVPAMLEPGEFVIRKPMAKAIGGKALGAMNATGAMTPGNVSVNINNQGSPKQAQVSAPKFNGDKYVIDIVTRDLRNNGSLRKSLRGGSAS